METGQSFSVLLAEPDLQTGVTFAIFHGYRNTPVFIDLFSMWHDEEEISLAESFNNPCGRFSR